MTVTSKIIKGEKKLENSSCVVCMLGWVRDNPLCPHLLIFLIIVFYQSRAFCMLMELIGRVLTERRKMHIKRRKNNGEQMSKAKGKWERLEFRSHVSYILFFPFPRNFSGIRAKIFHLFNLWVNFFNRIFFCIIPPKHLFFISKELVIFK